MKKSTQNLKPKQQTKQRSQKPEVNPLVNKTPLNPTRYGDWEKNGRCIDF